MGLQSRKVGWGKRDGGYPVCIFEALVPVQCADCGAEIQPGERFTRATRSFRTTAPLCLTCRPVEALPPGERVSPLDRFRANSAHTGNASHATGND